jgi:prefoldin subunit 5
VVICSSNEGVDFTAEARAKGAIGVLQKPPTPEQLTQVLDNLQALSQELKARPRSEPAMPVTAPKVTSLREPDVTIGQAVINVLRNSLAQPPAEPELPSAAVAVEATAPTPSQGLQREQVESRLKKLTQEIYAQISDLKATLAVVESRVRDPEEEQELLESASRRALAEMQQQIEALERRIDDRLAGLQSQFDAMLQEQDRRIAQVEQIARTVATEAAHTESERTVMSAAARIADQLADSILKALGRK